MKDIGITVNEILILWLIFERKAKIWFTARPKHNVLPVRVQNSDSGLFRSISDEHQFIKNKYYNEKSEPYEKHWSNWEPYISMIPSEYTLPIFWSQSEINLLPVKCQFDVGNELKLIKSKFEIVENLLNEFNPKAIIDYESFIWAYATGKWS